MQPTPVFLPGGFHGQRSLVGSPWDHKEFDMTERLFQKHFYYLFWLHWVLVVAGWFFLVAACGI